MVRWWKFRCASVIKNPNSERLFQIAGKHKISVIDEAQKIENVGSILKLFVDYDKEIQVFAGGTLDIKDKYSFDFPPIISKAQWETFLQQFWKDAETFALQVEQLSEEQLNVDFTNPNYGSYYRNIDGMIEHSYYHLGQIILINKLITSK